MNMPSADRRLIVGLTTIFEGGLLVLAVVLGWIVGVPALGQLEPSWPMFQLGALISLMLFVGVVVFLQVPWGPLVRLREILEEVTGALFARCTLFDLALIATLAGVGEEAFFRGFMQTALAEVLPPGVALVIVSLIFGLAHCVTVTYAVAAALIGGLFGWLLLHYDNLLVPMTAHAVYDFVVLTYLIHVRGVAAGRTVAETEDP